MPRHSLIKKIIFVVIYLAIDLLYVVYSQSVYNQAVLSIAHQPMPGSLRPVSILGAYTCMALGWALFALPTAERWSVFLSKPLAGLIAGALYGLVIIGTFNFTLNLMFLEWSGAIMLRDLLWGISWSSLSVGLYMLFYSKENDLNQTESV